MPRVMSVTTALAAAMLAGAPGALAQVTHAQGADTASIREAIHGNLLEVGLGRVAESRAGNDGVEKFAERMVSEHNAMNDQWARLAQDHDMRVTLDFGPAGAQTIDRLEDLDGAEFDQAYMTEMIRHHERDLAALQRMASSARSAKVRQLAASGSATVREHLALARQVGSGVGVSRTAGPVGGTGTPAPVASDDGRYDRDQRYDRDERDGRGDRDDRGSLRGEDRAFVQNVLQDHLMHVQLAERAQRDASSETTRRLAAQMEEEFERWQLEWEDVAERYDVRPPCRLGRLHQEKVDRLKRVSRGDLDRTYTAIVADHLGSVVPYFQKEGRAVRSGAVRRLVNEELPVIRQILAGVRGMEVETGRRPEQYERQ